MISTTVFHCSPTMTCWIMFFVCTRPNSTSCHGLYGSLVGNCTFIWLWAPLDVGYHALWIAYSCLPESFGFLQVCYHEENVSTIDPVCQPLFQSLWKEKRCLALFQTDLVPRRCRLVVSWRARHGKGRIGCGGLYAIDSWEQAISINDPRQLDDG